MQQAFDHTGTSPQCLQDVGGGKGELGDVNMACVGGQRVRSRVCFCIRRRGGGGGGGHVHVEWSV